MIGRLGASGCGAAGALLSLLLTGSAAGQPGPPQVREDEGATHGTPGPLNPGATVETGAPQKTMVMTDVVTSPVSRDGKNVTAVWAGQLYRGRGALHGATGAAELAGSFCLEKGELYVHGTRTDAKAAADTQPFPVVVTKGSVQAGSVGTHWYVFSDTTTWDTTYIVLLDPISGDEASRGIRVSDLADTDTTGHTLVRAELTQPGTYLKLPGHRLRAADTTVYPLSSNPSLSERVDEAKRRARLAGLR